MTELEVTPASTAQAKRRSAISWALGLRAVTVTPFLSVASAGRKSASVRMRFTKDFCTTMPPSARLLMSRKADCVSSSRRPRPGSSMMRRFLRPLRISTAPSS